MLSALVVVAVAVQAETLLLDFVAAAVAVRDIRLSISLLPLVRHTLTELARLVLAIHLPELLVLVELEEIQHLL
jgi:hypothetical protein